VEVNEDVVTGYITFFYTLKIAETADTGWFTEITIN